MESPLRACAPPAAFIVAACACGSGTGCSSRSPHSACWRCWPSRCGSSARSTRVFSPTSTRPRSSACSRRSSGWPRPTASRADGGSCAAIRAASTRCSTAAPTHRRSRVRRRSGTGGRRRAGRGRRRALRTTSRWSTPTDVPSPAIRASTRTRTCCRSRSTAAPSATCACNRCRGSAARRIWPSRRTRREARCSPCWWCWSARSPRRSCWRAGCWHRCARSPKARTRWPPAISRAASMPRAATNSARWRPISTGSPPASSSIARRAGAGVRTSRTSCARR